MKLVFSGPILEKYSSIKERKKQSSRSKVVPWGKANTQTDGRTDRHGEANSRFSQFCESAKKNNSL
jgi:hypothetical protein